MPERAVDLVHPSWERMLAETPELIEFKMPWAGDPRVNIQKGSGGKAKAYQVGQVVIAYDKLTKEGDNG
ncbi:hypothetical protein [Rhodococcus sp. T7]|uniref:hypothetical protein n=1 Tax=Rhodococcus sp. T7 TaxID=627444 RepID=UPI0013C5FDCC|nr:hypothetical protein [Rhodococcus sp. T7]KAF0966409.1 hypothetical protein MLGJGCBP_00428 [Rhodococcus sp. T7]